MLCVWTFLLQLCLMSALRPQRVVLHLGGYWSFWFLNADATPESVPPVCANLAPHSLFSWMIRSSPTWGQIIRECLAVLCLSRGLCCSARIVSSRCTLSGADTWSQANIFLCQQSSKRQAGQSETDLHVIVVYLVFFLLFCLSLKYTKPRTQVQTFSWLF